MFNPFATVRAAVVSGLTAALLITLCWGLRLDHLRAGYKNALSRVVVALHEVTGQPVSANNAPIAVHALGSLKDRYRAEREQARDKLEQQSASIRSAAEETERLRKMGEHDRALYVEMERQRNYWITEARNAETRTQRRSAEQEAKECEEVADALYNADF